MCSSSWYFHRRGIAYQNMFVGMMLRTASHSTHNIKRARRESERERACCVRTPRVLHAICVVLRFRVFRSVVHPESEERERAECYCSVQCSSTFSAASIIVDACGFRNHENRYFAHVRRLVQFDRTTHNIVNK